MDFSNPTQGIPYDGESTWANRGSGSRNGAIKYITDLADSGLHMRWNGTYWRVTAPVDVVLNTTTVTGDTTGNAQVLKQSLIPAGLLRACRYFNSWGVFGKNGTVDAATQNRVRLGTAGASPDTIIQALTGMSASHRSFSYETLFYVASSTSISILCSQALTGAAFTNAGTGAAHPITSSIADIDANALYLSQEIDLAGTSDAPQGFHMGLRLYP